MQSPIKIRSKDRTKLLVLLMALESVCSAAAPAGCGGWELSTARSRKLSLFGILGNVLGGTENDSNYGNGGFSRSLPYTRLGRLSISRGSSELRLDGWTRTEIACMGTEFTASRNSDMMEERPARFRRTKQKKSLSKRHRTSQPFPSSPREIDNSIEEAYGDDDTYDAYIDASLVATVEKSDISAMTSPIVPLTIAIDEQTGEEFSDPETIDRLVASGFEMATQDKNDWIEWKMHGSTKKLLEENNHNEMAILEQGEVMVYIGKSKREGHGSKLPIIKTKSILPLSAEEMADLLMDSSKVKIYNKLSVGRTDVRTLGPGTKIVCNLTKPPIAKSNMVSCTMMHSRRLNPGSESDSSYFVVSRATPGMVDDTMSELPRNDILLGVNLLQDRGPNECIMTAVTHVYSPALPTILAKKMGVSSAINFVKDIRSSCGSVAN